jgi:hypothetical protein
MSIRHEATARSRRVGHMTIAARPTLGSMKRRLEWPCHEGRPGIRRSRGCLTAAVVIALTFAKATPGPSLGGLQGAEEIGPELELLEGSCVVLKLLER